MRGGPQQNTADYPTKGTTLPSPGKAETGTVAHTTPLSATVCALADGRQASTGIPQATGSNTGGKCLPVTSLSTERGVHTGSNGCRPIDYWRAFSPGDTELGELSA